MEDEENKGVLTGDTAMGAAVTVLTGDDAMATGKRGRPPADVAAALDGPTYTQDKTYRADAPFPAFVADNEVVKGRPNGGILN